MAGGGQFDGMNGGGNQLAGMLSRYPQFQQQGRMNDPGFMPPQEPPMPQIFQPPQPGGMPQPPPQMQQMQQRVQQMQQPSPQMQQPQQYSDPYEAWKQGGRRGPRPIGT